MFGQKGQISAEFVLILGFIFLIAIAVGTYSSQSSELNNVMGAAKMGFMDASNKIAYSGSGNILRFQNMTSNNNNIIITVYSMKPLSTAEKNLIISNMQQYIVNVTNQTYNIQVINT